MREGLREGWAGEGDSLLERARTLGLLSALDHRFAARLAELYGESAPGVRWALALACRQEAAGHVCADLPQLADDGLVVEIAGEVRSYSALGPQASLDGWLDELRGSRLVTCVADPAPAPAPEADGEIRPLVLDEQGRLFLQRAYRHQCELADRLRARGRRAHHAVDWARAEEAIRRLSPSDATEDAPARAALRAGLARPLTVVTGGPGTGKTTMVARLIALLVEAAQAAGRPAPRVRLLAPTGKAAAAMANAFAQGRGQLEVAEPVRAALPQVAETIHRALHRQTRVDAFGRPESVRLEAEVVVVDEASMVDLALMNRLLAACEGVDRLILLGDPDQLASVDSGAVLAELCTERSEDRPAPDFAASPGPASARDGLLDSIVTLRKSHRFSGTGGIGRLAAAIREGDAEGVIALLDDPALPEISRFDASRSQEVVGRLVEESRAMHQEIERASEAAEKLDRTGRYRVLCAHRLGPLGVESLCARLDEAAATLRQTTVRAGWWKGRLLLVTRNAPEQDLWNGDVGLIDQTPSGLRALFPDGRGGVRALSAGRLPSHESAIAMSVHKSQGSEFDVVDLVLGDSRSPLMTRELLYTGVTRARTTLRVHASVEAIRSMVARRIERDSGLADRLWVD